LKYINEVSFTSIIKAIPARNRRELVSNLTCYAKNRVASTEYDKIVDFLNSISMQLETFTNLKFQEESESKYNIKALTTRVFDLVLSDDL
jgi:hypothetical protein